MIQTWPTVALFLTIASFAGVPIPKESYRPYPHPYPQIIQAQDYPTIDAIERLVHRLERTGSDAVSCEAVLNGVRSSTFSGGPIKVGNRRYKTKATIEVFATLNRLVSDLSRSHTCSSARFIQYGTRAYKTVSVLEFDLGPIIVVLESLSNGPDDEERLYILDAVAPEESFFFRNVESTDG